MQCSLITSSSLVEAIVCHLTDSIEMDKGCCDDKHMEDLMALELQEKKDSESLTRS